MRDDRRRCIPYRGGNRYSHVKNLQSSRGENGAWSCALSAAQGCEGSDRRTRVSDVVRCLRPCTSALLSLVHRYAIFFILQRSIIMSVREIGSAYVNPQAKHHAARPSIILHRWTATPFAIFLYSTTHRMPFLVFFPEHHVIRSRLCRTCKDQRNEVPCMTRTSLRD